MCYVAGDNPLSPLFIEQLKAIKDAGFAQNVEVLVYFDASETGVPTQIFNVNTKRKVKEPATQFQVGDAADSFVRNMVEDRLELPAGMRRMLSNEGGVDAAQSLELFLDFCLGEARADHYMLFLMGHGMVVGNDAFLPDSFPLSGIKLTQLGTILRDRFGSGSGNSLELLGMHCCAMSGIEVLYELKDSARFMIASEGLSFVGGWPYRQLLKRLFKGLERHEPIEEFVEDIYWLTYFNARDFGLAGYPLELTLCSLSADKIDALTPDLRELVRQMVQGLRAKDDDATDAIQLAHLKSQSYFDELYTDIFDFCQCLAEKCRTDQLTPLRHACGELMKKLEPVRGTEKTEVLKRFESLIIHASHFGWSSQYSHGLSVYFPWVEQNRKSEKSPMDEYKDYEFTKALGGDSWFSFLSEYFVRTMRTRRTEEDAQRGLDDKFSGLIDFTDIQFNDNANSLFLGALEKPTGGSGKITGGSDKPTGGSSMNCDCPMIKNYPKDVLV